MRLSRRPLGTRRLKLALLARPCALTYELATTPPLCSVSATTRSETPARVPAGVTSSSSEAWWTRRPRAAARSGTGGVAPGCAPAADVGANVLGDEVFELRRCVAAC